MNLTAKLGPLPVWVWGLIIGGFAVVWMWVSQRGSGTATETPAETVGTTPNGPGGDFSQVPVLPSGQVIEKEVTNAEWLTQAVNAIVNRGVGTNLAAQAALLKYLSGQTLTTAESRMVEVALSAVGQPPQGVSGISEITPEGPTAAELAAQEAARAAESARAAEASRLQQMLAAAQAAASAAVAAAQAAAQRAAQAVSQPAPAPAPAPAPSAPAPAPIGPLSASQVRALQAGLNRVFPAYSKLVVDGVYGPRTRAVVTEFQRRAGIQVDGIVGAQTRAALSRYGINF